LKLCVTGIEDAELKMAVSGMMSGMSLMGVILDQVGVSVGKIRYCLDLSLLYHVVKVHVRRVTLRPSTRKFDRCFGELAIKLETGDFYSG
jgi:hypothetical protein